MPKKSKKSDAELDKQFVDKVQHCARNVDKWLGKLVKISTKSRRKLTQNQREKIAAHITDSAADAAKDLMSGKETKEEFVL